MHLAQFSPLPFSPARVPQPSRQSFSGGGQPPELLAAGRLTAPARKVPKVEDLFKDLVCEVEDRERTPASSLPRRHLKTLAIDTRPSPPASSPHRSLPLERSRLRRRAPSNSTATRRSSGATPPQLRLPTRSPPPIALSHSSSCSGWILIGKVLRCDFMNYWCPLVIAFCFVLQITMHAN
jgi:hypothetical protein